MWERVFYVALVFFFHHFSCFKGVVETMLQKLDETVKAGHEEMKSELGELKSQLKMLRLGGMTGAYVKIMTRQMQHVWEIPDDEILWVFFSPHPVFFVFSRC